MVAVVSPKNCNRRTLQLISRRDPWLDGIIGKSIGGATAWQSCQLLQFDRHQSEPFSPHGHRTNACRSRQTTARVPSWLKTFLPRSHFSNSHSYPLSSMRPRDRLPLKITSDPGYLLQDSFALFTGSLTSMVHTSGRRYSCPLSLPSKVPLIAQMHETLMMPLGRVPVVLEKVRVATPTQPRVYSDKPKSAEDESAWQDRKWADGATSDRRTHDLFKMAAPAISQDTAAGGDAMLQIEVAFRLSCEWGGRDLEWRTEVESSPPRARSSWDATPSSPSAHKGTLRSWPRRRFGPVLWWRRSAAARVGRWRLRIGRAGSRRGRSTGQTYAKRGSSSVGSNEKSGRTQEHYCEKRARDVEGSK